MSDWLSGKMHRIIPKMLVSKTKMRKEPSVQSGV